MANTIGRGAYAAMFGPTTGDRIRLADTELVIEVESDRTIYGEEVKFGGGKVIRDGMGQGQKSRAEGAGRIHGAAGERGSEKRRDRNDQAGRESCDGARDAVFV